MTTTKLRVWWVPQVPGKPFLVDVASVDEGVQIMSTLADYDRFQLENNIKPDYCNAGGLMASDPDDDTDGPDSSWSDWYDEATGEDDPAEYLKTQRTADEKATSGTGDEAVDGCGYEWKPGWYADRLHAVEQGGDGRHAVCGFGFPKYLPENSTWFQTKLERGVKKCKKCEQKIGAANT